MSSKLICFKHKTYDGTSAPVISCKTCCSIFLKSVKENRDAGVYIDYKKISLEGTGLHSERMQRSSK